MKNFLTLFIVLISFTASAQFDVNSGEKTDDIINIEGQQFTVYMTAKQSPYIICESPKTKNNYAVWIGEAAELDGEEVRVSKSGKYFKLIISKNTNNPYPKYLKKKQDEIVGKKLTSKTTRA